MSVGLLFMLVRVICVSMILFYVIRYEVNVMFLSFSGKYFKLGANIDFVSIFAILMLLICFTYVLSYSKHYFDGDKIYIDLNKIICIFVGVMSSLILTGDFLSTSYLSLRSSIITLVSSRFGDVSLFMLIMISRGFLINIHIPLILIFLFIILTKRARFPFISWLLEAMRAPTPIRSLVHSSTLVAAGVWFSMRYDFLLYFDNILLLRLLLLLTIFISGLFFLYRFKEDSGSINFHGVSKCMLFMLVGDVMRGSRGSQSSKCVYKCYLYGNWGLSGAPFIGVFFTKHLLLTNIMNVNKESNEVASNGIVVSTSLIMFQIISCFTAYVMYKSNILVNWRSSLFGSDSIVESFYYTFANCINICSTFFYRWDKFSLNLFKKNCVRRLIYK
uniref:NADH:ubiquinone reductase (H(+)-translocating) n=1 Tax=Rodentolepis nana TaxID=102285 RepID=A0A0R3TB35_RODNA